MVGVQYQWEKSSILDNIYYEPPDVHTHGQEGTHYWRFEAAQVGLGKIELAYRRSCCFQTDI
jgi:predicted secreted protein